MKCLILAAGKGTRLSNKGLPKPLVSVLGLPIIERVILTAKASGITEFLVVTGYEGDRVRKFLLELKEREKISLTLIENPQWEKENGVSVLCSEAHLTEPFILTMCDHLLPENAFKNLLGTEVKDGEITVSVDYGLDKFSREELEEATKVQVKDGLVVKIGKDLRQYDGVDTGLFLCSPAIFQALKISEQKGDTTLSGGIRVMAAEGRVKAIGAPPEKWFDIDDAYSLKKAEKALLFSLKKPTDGPVSRYINRPISLRITRSLVNTRMTANQISWLSFAVALAAACSYAVKGYGALIVGGILTQLSSILDGCDGEVARLKYQVSEFGGWFDAVLDRYADALLLFGLTLHLLWCGGGIGSMAAGFFSVTGSLINSYTAHKYDAYLKLEHMGKAVTFRLGRDVRLFLIFLGAVSNQALGTLVLLAVIMNLENVRRVWVLYGVWSKDHPRR